MRIALSLLLIMLCLPGISRAANDFQLPDDPRQSITYWKPHVLPANNPLVKRAESVFSVLLQGWDPSRLAPGLAVIQSADGAWAASLADGNILLSQQAIEICLKLGQKRGDDLLAFVLAHELAHQRADDLWHQRFFRMMGNQLKQQIQHDLKIDGDTIADIEQKEAQADHDGLILMSSVGYDPFQVLEAGNFFTAWVENIWQQSCDSAGETAITAACQQAEQRALRTRTQLKQVARQSLLYEMGVQSFIAGHYPQARQYFTVYGRDYPGRQVLSAIGLSYLAEAVALQHQLIEKSAIKQPDFYYPLFLEASNHLQPSRQFAKRASEDAYIEQLKSRQKKYLKQAALQFEKAIRLSSAYRKNYILLAMTHLLQQNSYLLRGVIQGQYILDFGSDGDAEMLLAMNEVQEDKKQQAGKHFKRLIKQIAENRIQPPDDLLLYGIYYNYSALLEFNQQKKAAKKLWKQFADNARKKGNSLLFRLALARLKPGQKKHQSRLDQALTIGGKRLGDTVPEGDNIRRQPLWIEGEAFYISRDPQGHHWISRADGPIVFAWQTMPRQAQAESGIKGLHLGDKADRVFKTLGVADRKITLSNGSYLAYDEAGIAIQIQHNKINGWFIY